MSAKYEALVGYLFVAGGRPISTPPPGARVQVAPKRAHRSREQDTLFILVTPAGQRNAKAEFYEQLAKKATETFFSSRLGVTGALREAASALNTQIQQLNLRQAADYRAGALLLVKRGEDVYVMRAGTTLCVVYHDGAYETFPLDPDMLNMLPLGSRSEPMVEFTHFSLNANDIFVLGDAGVAALSDTILQEAASQSDIEAVLDRLEPAVERQAFAMVIQFIDPDAPSLPTVGTAAASQEASLVEVAAPGVRSDYPTVNEEALAAPTVSLDSTEMLETASLQSVDEMPLAEAQAVGSDQATRHDQATGDTVPEEKSPRDLSRSVGLGCLLLLTNILHSISHGINAVLDRLLPEPEGGKNQPLVPMNIVALMAVIIPALVVVVVVGVFISSRDTTAYEELRAEALNAHEEALQVEEATGATAQEKRNYWIGVRYWAEKARQENDSEEMRDLILEAQNHIDFYDRVTRVSVTQMREFGENADLRGPILSPGGLDLYTLDRNRSQIYRDRLDGRGVSMVEVGQEPIVQRARPINEYLVQNIIDIAWITNGGAATRNALIALDDAGLLISYHGTFGLDAIQLQLPVDWSRPEAIAVWGRNFYVLDAGSDQIWRYVPESSFYQNPPEEYFSGNNRPELGAAVDFGIDEDGLVYILFNDGTISKFQGGDPVAYELNEDTAPADGITSGSALFISTDPRAYALYVADQQNDTIYEISLGGTVNGGYRPTDLLSNAFDTITGLYVEVALNNIYVLSGDALYQIPRTP